MVLELINNRLISVQQRDECKRYIIFHVKNTTYKFWNDTEMLLKSFWTSHLQMMNVLEPLFCNWTGRQKGIPNGVDEIQPCRELWPKVFYSLDVWHPDFVIFK